MNNKEELEKYKKELADLEAKDKQQKPKSTMDNMVQKMREDKKKASDRNIVWIIVAAIFLVPLAGIFIAFLIFPGLIIPVGMLLSDIPRAISLPYNAIDFQKIAYINNQFIMYGIDYDRGGLNQLVIFNSTDGKKWDKSDVDITDDNLNQPISVAGTFNYYRGKCYLIGATVQPLVAPDCKHWQTQTTNKIMDKNNYLYNAHSSAIANNELYIGGDKGVYKTSDGLNWSQEQLPYPEESNVRNFENRFYSMASGNNKLITASNWWHNKQRTGLIYTKDLTTNQWRYEEYSVPVSNITRGKDRFVGMTESSALVLMDGNSKNWNLSKLKTNSDELSFGLQNMYVGINIVNVYNGENWYSFVLENEQFRSLFHLACNYQVCIAVGVNYKIISSNNGVNWELESFNHKHPKPSWWRRFINF